MNSAIAIAILALAGSLGASLVKRINLPAITGYLLAGFILGPSFFNIITTDIYNSLGLINSFAISMLTISVGMELHRNVIRENGKTLFTLSIINTLFSAIIVFFTTWILGMDAPYAIILGILSMTVSPVGVIAIVTDERASGSMTDHLIRLVGFDNLFCITLFGIALSFVQALTTGNTNSFTQVIGLAIVDILLGAVLGFLTGAFFAYFVRRDLSIDRLLVLFIAIIMLNIGVATWLNISPILTSIVSGISIGNLVNRPSIVTQVFKRIETPTLTLFLTLSGAHINLSVVLSVWLIGLGYILARSFGRWFGIYVAGGLANISNKERKNLGLGLFPQAGIAIGLSTVAEQALPNSNGILTAVILTAVIFFEILGPLIARKGLENMGETASSKAK